jgi:outer membrane protein assembly factor BamD (BamD/ComL family)
MLSVARTALARGQYAFALEALEHHASRYPDGRLAEEREVLAIQALVGAGRRDEARARAERFRRQHPHSLFAPVAAEADDAAP